MATSRPLRFSSVEPHEVALVAKLRDMHRGTVPKPPHPGYVPDGPQEQLQLRLVTKAYVRGHSRTLPDGRTVTVQPYFTRVIPKGKEPAKPRPTKRQPPAGVYQDLTPERLAQRLLQHVQDGKLTHAEAHANLDHLAQRAHAGHGMAHGIGHAWTPHDVHAFVEHARERLQGHQMEQEQEQREQRQRAHDERLRQQAREEEEQHRRQREQAHAEEEKRRQAEEEAKRQLEEQRERARAEYRKIIEQERQKDREKAEAERRDQEEARKKPRLPQEVKLHKAHFDQAPPYIQAAIQKAAPLKVINPKGSRGSFYQSFSKTISHRPWKRYPDAPGPIWRHEFGHHVDYEMGGGGSMTASNAAVHAMEKDRRALAPDVPTLAARIQARSTLVEAQTSALYRATTRLASTNAAAEDAWKQHGLSMAEVATLLPGGPELETHARALVAWEQKDAAAFFGAVASTPACGMVQDAVGAVTRNAIKLAWSHSDAYYGTKNLYTQRHCTEAYANWFSAHGSGESVWPKVYAHFLPETNSLFQRMTEYWTGMTTKPPLAS